MYCVSLSVIETSAKNGFLNTAFGMVPLIQGVDTDEQLNLEKISVPLSPIHAVQ